MAGKRAAPRPHELAQANAPENEVELPGTEGELPGATEHIGPLRLERLLKADGRALILYSTEQRE